MDVELYRYKGKKFLCNQVAAMLPGTQVALAQAALSIAAFAEANLREHHGRTEQRFHDLPAPQIAVERRYDEDYGSVDYYVSLEAYDRSPGLALGRAIAIEYGHEYESYERNRSGPWGRSGGTRVLGRAVDAVAAFGGF